MGHESSPKDPKVCLRKKYFIDPLRVTHCCSLGPMKCTWSILDHPEWPKGQFLAILRPLIVGLYVDKNGVLALRHVKTHEVNILQVGIKCRTVLDADKPTWVNRYQKGMLKRAKSAPFDIFKQFFKLYYPMSADKILITHVILLSCSTCSIWLFCRNTWG